MKSEVWLDIECLSAMARVRGADVAGGRNPGTVHWRDGGVFLDLTGSGITRDALALFVEHARNQGLFLRRDALFEGQRSAASQPRHLPLPALRRPWGKSAVVDGTDISLAIAQARHWPECMAQAVRDGSLTGATGRRFSDVLHLGEARDAARLSALANSLAPVSGGPRVHFLSERDGPALRRLMARLDPAETLVVLAFADPGAEAARGLAEPVLDWVRRGVGERRAARHFAAVTRSARAAFALGVPAERVIAADADWLADFSVWSPVNLGLMIALGPETLAEMRDGAYQADRHFETAGTDSNLPVLLAFYDMWLEAMGAAPSRAQVCDPALSGWDVLGGVAIGGGQDDPTEYVVAALPASEEWSDFEIRRTADDLARKRRPSRPSTGVAAEGGARVARPSIVLAYRKMDARTMGRLIALAEHRAFVAAILRSVPERAGAQPRLDEFEARALRSALNGGPVSGFDPKTSAILGSLMGGAGASPLFPDAQPGSNVVPLHTGQRGAGGASGRAGAVVP